ncbi:type IV pilus biogenesis protein PilN [Halalkalibacter wakoensis JCM 9140]|uniref:Type IV pilus biogenesis protein PilN n=1 Tax=Halalkalibacter wakoensis JCM 9140 TaxID=1236970 RepID=W4Q956_9BACI|nr:PilN domain-containing protein [Halalkalibacter wakoensis]GAE28596.1 type IV pilus biogenesis protein PilN [Halalkalibacter wakoensis JCM 9140]
MMVEINLLPQKERKSFYSIIILLAIIIVLLVTSLIYFMYTNNIKNEIARTEQTIETTEQLRMVQEQQLADAQQSSMVDVLEAQIDWIEQQQISGVSLLSHFVRKLPEKAYFMNYTYVDQGTVQIFVQFESPIDVSSYLHELTDSRFVQSADLLNINAQEIIDEEGLSEDLLPRYLANFEVKLNVNEIKVEEGNG